MTHLFNDNHTFLLLLVLIGGYKVFSFAIDLFRALPLMYYWWRVTKKCEGAYISQISDPGYPYNIYCEGLLLSCGNTPTEAWRNAWAYLNAKKNTYTMKHLPAARLFAFQVATWFIAAAYFWSVFKISPQMALGLIPMVFYAFMGAWLIQILVQKVNIFDDSETLP